LALSASTLRRASAAEVAGVERQLAPEVGRRRRLPLRDLVQHPHLGQGVAAALQGLVEQAELARAEAAEAAQRRHGVFGLARSHPAIIAAMLAPVNELLASVNEPASAGRLPRRR
jgi:hypothetical protein